LLGQAARRLPGARLIAADIADELPFDDSSFDVALCECVLSLTEDSAPVISEIHRVLRPGAVAIISDICAASELEDTRAAFARAGLYAAHFEDHRAALVTFAAEVYTAGLCPCCYETREERASINLKNSTYYLFICRKGDTT